MDLVEALADVEARLPKAERAVETAQRAFDDLLVEKRGLELALARHRLSTSTPPTPQLRFASPSQSPDGDWATLGRADAVHRVLVEAGRPLSPQEIVHTLVTSGGRSEDNDQVRAALNYLRRTSRAESVGRAQWVATGSGDADTAPATPEALGTARPAQHAPPTEEAALAGARPSESTSLKWTEEEASPS